MNNKNSKITKYNFLWRVLQTLSKQGIVFIITFLSAKLLTPINFGNYSYILTITMFTVTLSDMGISAAISRFVSESKAKNSNDEDKFLTSGVISVFVISSLIVVLCYLVLPVFLKEKMNLFYLVMPVIIFSPIASVFDGFYRGIGDFKKISIISFSNGIFSIVYIYLLIDGFGLKGALVSQSLFYVSLVISFIFTYNYKKGIRWDINIGKKIISYSVIIGLSSVAAFFYSKVDILILGKFGFIKEVGYYELVLQFFTIIVLPTSILSQVLAPKITFKLNFDDKYIYSYYKKKMLLLLTYSIIISLFFYWVSPILLKHFFNKYYVEEVFVAISVMAFLIPAKVWGVFQNQAFIVSTGKAKIVLYTTIVGGILNVVLDYIFIKKYGFIGVYYVTLFVHTLNIVIQTLYFNNYLRNHVKKR